MHANGIKFFESEHRIPIHSHRVELGTGKPNGPPWSMPIGTEILIHDPTIRGNLGRLWVLTLPQSNESLITPGRANFVAALLLQIYPRLLNFIIDMLEMKLIFFCMVKFFVAFYEG